MDIVFSVVAVLVSVASLVFLAYQTRLGRATAELSFNLQLMERLDTVMMAIADRPEAHAGIWCNSDGVPPDNRAPHVLSQGLIDVLEVALAAGHRLPGFHVNKQDWQAYAKYVLENSAAVRQQIVENPGWWPVIEGFIAEAGLGPVVRSAKA